MCPQRGARTSPWGDEIRDASIQTSDSHLRDGPGGGKRVLVKRKVFAAVAAFALMGGLAACGSDDEGGGGGSESSANKDPLRVALIPPSSGALATFGKDAAEAWQFAADEANAG